MKFRILFDPLGQINKANMPQEYSSWCKERFIVKKLRKENRVPSQVNFREHAEIAMTVFIFPKPHMSVVHVVWTPGMCRLPI